MDKKKKNMCLWLLLDDRMNDDNGIASVFAVFVLFWIVLWLLYDLENKVYYPSSPLDEKR